MIKYDNLGRMIEEKANEGVYKREYKGEETLPSREIGPRESFSFENTFIAGERRMTKEIRDNGKTISFEYDQKGRLTKQTDSNGFGFTYSYSEDGKRTTTHFTPNQ